VLPVSAIDDTVATIEAIDRLLHRVMDEVHVLVLPDADQIERTTWFLGLRPHRKEFVRHAVLASAFRPVRACGPHRLTYTIGMDLDPVQAASLAYVPLVILVENERTDGQLVCAAVLTYASPEAQRLWSTAFSTGRSVELRSRGGHGELGHLVREIYARAASANLPVRLVVMTDSDSKFPGDESAAVVSLRAECVKRGVPIKVLSCKTIENYIPDRAFELWSSAPDRAGARPAVKALKRLLPDARDHFPMKGTDGAKARRPNRGIAAIDRNPDAPVQQKALFATVSPADRAALDDGFSDSIINLVDVHLPQLSAADFDGRDQRGDLRHLATMISDLL
jgi:hypothetical protein